MKSKLLTATTVLLAAFSHVAPALAMAMIAAGDEITRVFGTMILFVSSALCGYFHGMNRTHETF